MHSVRLQEGYQLLIGGQWKDVSDRKTFKTICSVDGSVLAECAGATREDVDEAVKTAWKAFESWKHVTANERAVIPDKIADIINANQEHLTTTESLDNGKPIRGTVTVDIPMPAQYLWYFAGCTMTDRDSASMLGESALSLILRKSIGVVGQIMSWNFPFLMAVQKLVPVFACRCCAAFKSSSAMPLSVLEFVKLVQDVLPAGVFSMITGSGSESSQYMLEHRDFRKLAFTDSTEVGRNVALATVRRLIPSTLESGGKSTNILFGDCSWEVTMDGLQMGILFNQGQAYCTGSRVSVQESMHDRFVGEAVKHFGRVEVGLPWEADTQMGSQISKVQMEKILKYMEVGESEGVSVLCGGQHLKTEGLENGCFPKLTLLGNATNHMRVAQGEIFGPVACILKFRTEDEVVQTANDSEYGLGRIVWTRDINRALRVSRTIETGRMWVNIYNVIPEGMPFGGYKALGIGHETHKVILEHYTQMKNIMISLSETPTGFYPVKQSAIEIFFMWILYIEEEQF